MWSNHFEAAIEKFKKALDLLDKNEALEYGEGFRHERYIKIAQCYFELNKPEQSRKYLKKGKKLAEEINDRKWIDKADNLLDLRVI